MKTLLAHTVAQALTRHLEKENTSIHWINVAGEASLKEVPEKAWPNEDFMLNLMLTQGNSEGMLVYVMAQENRYKPEEAKPILQIKMLGNYKTVLSEMAVIWKFLENVESMKEKEPSIDLEKIKSSNNAKKDYVILIGGGVCGKRWLTHDSIEDDGEINYYPPASSAPELALRSTSHSEIQKILKATIKRFPSNEFRVDVLEQLVEQPEIQPRREAPRG